MGISNYFSCYYHVSNVIFLYQQKYIVDFLKETNFINCKPISNPIILIRIYQRMVLKWQMNNSLKD